MNNKKIQFFIILLFVVSISLRVYAKYNYTYSLKAFTILKNDSYIQNKKNVEKDSKVKNDIIQESTENIDDINNNKIQEIVNDNNSLKYVIIKHNKSQE